MLIVNIHLSLCEVFCMIIWCPVYTEIPLLEIKNYEQISWQKEKKLVPTSYTALITFHKETATWRNA